MWQMTRVIWNRWASFYTATTVKTNMFFYREGNTFLYVRSRSIAARFVCYCHCSLLSSSSCSNSSWVNSLATHSATSARDEEQRRTDGHSTFLNCDMQLMNDTRYVCRRDLTCWGFQATLKEPDTGWLYSIQMSRLQDCTSAYKPAVMTNMNELPFFWLLVCQRLNFCF